MRGKLILIEGTDCSGKQTQTEMLVKRLKNNNFKVETFSFPMYETPTGKIVGGPYLGKKSISEGYFKEGADNVSPMVSSLYYAADRKYNIKNITTLLEQGINVILDRYTISNIAHQGSKIKNKEDRLNLYKWIEKLEFDLLELPKPDICMLLHMPYKYSLKLLKNRTENDQNENEEHIKNAEKTYLELSKIYNFKIIECVIDNKIRVIEDINDELFSYLTKILDSSL